MLAGRQRKAPFFKSQSHGFYTNLLNVCVPLSATATSVWKRELSHVHAFPSLKKNRSESQRPQGQYIREYNIVGASLPNLQLYIYNRYIHIYIYISTHVSHNLSLVLSCQNEKDETVLTRSNFSLQGSPASWAFVFDTACHADWQRD